MGLKIIAIGGRATIGRIKFIHSGIVFLIQNEIYRQFLVFFKQKKTMK